MDFLDDLATLLARDNSVFGIDPGLTVSHSDTALSEASTIPSNDVGIQIQAFCVFNSWIYTIPYPTEGDGWVYRSDMGGHSHYRWEYNDAIVLVARHSTCTRALIPKEPCRNCLMKHVWRRECMDPCNSFYIFEMHRFDDCLNALKPLVLSAYEASVLQATQYMTNKPKLAVTRKRVDTQNVKDKRMRRLEQNLRHSLMSPIPACNDPDPSDLYAMLNAMVDDMTDDSQVPAVRSDTLSVPGLLPSPCETDALPDPTEANDADFWDLTSVVNGYNHVIQELTRHQNGRVFMSRTIVCNFLSTSTPVMTTPLLMHSHSLQALFHSLSVSGNAQLLVKSSCLKEWFQRLVEAEHGERLAIHVGFYIAPTVSLFTAVYNATNMPTFVTQSMHKVEMAYDAALVRAKSGVKPILVAYFLPNVHSMVFGAHILPLGLITSS